MALSKSAPVSANNVTDLAEVRASKAGKPPAGKKANPHKNRRFDKEKVERIKAEIEAGRYVIDPTRIADKFIEHERNQ